MHEKHIQHSKTMNNINIFCKVNFYTLVYEFSNLIHLKMKTSKILLIIKIKLSSIFISYTYSIFLKYLPFPSSLSLNHKLFIFFFPISINFQFDFLFTQNPSLYFHMPCLPSISSSLWFVTSFLIEYWNKQL